MAASRSLGCLQHAGAGTAAGKAFLDMLGVFAEFETNLRREYQLEGIKAAKARAIYKGCKPSIDAAEVGRLGIGRAGVQRVLGVRQSAMIA